MPEQNVPVSVPVQDTDILQLVHSEPNMNLIFTPYGIQVLYNMVQTRDGVAKDARIAELEAQLSSQSPNGSEGDVEATEPVVAPSEV